MILNYLILISLVKVAVSDPKIDTLLGGIKGSYQISTSGKRYEVYEGIPYAEPPVGKLRFQPPRQIKAWSGSIAATKPGSHCLQYLHLPNKPMVTGSEDCLYLNIHVPERSRSAVANSSSLLPVLFWIHGGAFQYGSGSGFGAKYLIDHNVILVTINYRLGPLGFLSTEDEIVPGNMGLKDQNMALRWVSENIQSFGGDPKKITLVGLSAGGSSVHYHYLSPLSAGLFQGGMSISGTALDCWALAEHSLEKAQKLGDLMGCPTNDVEAMIECLRYRPPQALVQAVAEFMPWLYNPYSPFGPVIEKSKDSSFIDRSPVEIIKTGKVYDAPWITSATSEEGLYPAAEFVTNDQLLKELDEKWESIAPFLLDFNFTSPMQQHANVSRLIKEHYLKGKPISQETAQNLIQMIGDRLFVADSVKAAFEQAKANKKPVWYYYFTYRGAHSYSEGLSLTTKDLGVSHGDDVPYVLFDPLVDTSTTPKDREMQKTMMDLWVSFIKQGVPSVSLEWSKVDPTQSGLIYLKLSGPQELSMERSENFGQMKFWDSMNFIEN